MDELKIFSKIAVHYKLITPEQLGALTKGAAHVKTPLDLSKVMVEYGLVSQQRADWLLGVHKQYLAKQQGAGGTQPATQSTQASPAAPSPKPEVGAPEANSAAESTVDTEGANAADGGPADEVLIKPLDPSAIGDIKGEMNRVLLRGVQNKVSDIHIHSAGQMLMRKSGLLLSASDQSLPPERAKSMLFEILTPEQAKTLEERGEIDFAYELPGVGRFRANAYRQHRGYDGIFRAIPDTPPTLADLGLPENLADLTHFHQGLVLVTGSAGCGKSSTLAALVRLISEQRHDHILTVEDPIEFVFESKTCNVNQRQAGVHTESFSRALRAALREDPDIIVIGELRDLETISLALTAAETGHLVLGTLHTNSAVRTINRIIGAFPSEQQAQVRAMVSESLRAVISQQLIPRTNGDGRAVALEILRMTKAVSNLIREDKTFQLRSILQTGSSQGMALMDNSLVQLVKDGEISVLEARKYCEDPKMFA